ncbi:MAG: TIGR00341 family protein, partial [Spirochaetota bacterium]|nr:TIGR00341 family protein [Spirochaetota bacterium]
RFSKEFVVLLYTSCFIATMGLFQDSAAVIIGAMIIAPLMMPILGFSLGTIWGDMGLLIRSILTLLIGTFSVLVISSSLTMLIPGVELNSQINARINPNLYDIIIALASGVVGAYAYVNPRTSSTISGVAISVALMPPLCTIGITLGQWNLQAATGATLLYLTNLVSIALAASLVFWRLRIHPVTESRDQVKVRAKRKLFITAIMLIMISVPLGYFMRETYIIKTKQSQVKELLKASYKNVTILSLAIRKYPAGHEVNAVLVIGGNRDLSVTQSVKTKIKSLFPKEVVKLNLVTLSETMQK